MRKSFSSWYTILFWEKAKENLRKNRNIKLITTEKILINFLSEPNNYTRKLFIGNVLAVEVKKTQILTNNSVYLGLAILDLSKTVMFEF